ncbi:NADH-quinone oxidoreductase subunit K [Pseudohongiella spirulinae]|uniref:NADH-ubiquinone oxidoreductase, subunit 4L n=1 Tax=Pseudohongiella spirulinae TaxID=1249552 RepID=A0A0S2K9X7_9GAMM|nr:NADH-quinone oxidoreductase subunit K [Pseudohongiella spirulinae]ALO45033.1 NADH-ubiquinone oxidoreductase, subunit 4L [Pseudohongiella spirulinae]
MSELPSESLTVYLLASLTLISMGLYGLATLRDPIRRLIAINIIGPGVFLIMITLARRQDPPDAILHALVVTGLVVAISATAFALRLIIASEKHLKSEHSKQEPS